MVPPSSVPGTKYVLVWILNISKNRITAKERIGQVPTAGQPVEKFDTVLSQYGPGTAVRFNLSKEEKPSQCPMLTILHSYIWLQYMYKQGICATNIASAVQRYINEPWRCR